MYKQRHPPPTAAPRAGGTILVLAAPCLCWVYPAFSNRFSRPPSHKLCEGRFWGPCLSVGFLPGCQTCCKTTEGLTSTDHLLSRLSVMYLVLHASLMGKSWPEIEQPFPEAPCSRGRLIDTESISPCVLGGSLQKFSLFSLASFTPVC